MLDRILSESNFEDHSMKSKYTKKDFFKKMNEAKSGTDQYKKMSDAKTGIDQ